MTFVPETELRMALRHVQKGRECIGRQMRVLTGLRDKDLPTDEAERVLLWLEETQRQFEAHYRNLLDAGSRRIEPKNIDAAPFGHLGLVEDGQAAGRRLD